MTHLYFSWNLATQFNSRIVVSDIRNYFIQFNLVLISKISTSLFCWSCVTRSPAVLLVVSPKGIGAIRIYPYFWLWTYIIEEKNNDTLTIILVFCSKNLWQFSLGEFLMNCRFFSKDHCTTQSWSQEGQKNCYWVCIKYFAPKPGAQLQDTIASQRSLLKKMKWLCPRRPLYYYVGWNL